MGMYKVLIVDDEKPARELIKHIIDWDGLGFEICGEAKNGREALEGYHMFEPDIIITDIQMPIMNGLDLIKEIRSFDQEQKFIVLSCHEEFSFAREAFLLNVEDYLIKDLLRGDELNHLLLSIAENKNEKKKKHMEDKQQRVVVHNKGLIEYIAKQGSKEVRNFMEIDKGCMYRMVIMGFDDYYKSNLPGKEYDQEEMKNSLICALESFNLKENQDLIHAFAYMGSGKAIVIIQIANSMNEHIKLQSTMNILSRFRTYFSKTDQIHTMTMAISRDFNDLDGFMERYNEAYQALKYRLFLGKGKNIFYNTSIPRLTQMSEQALESKIEKIKVAVEDCDACKMKDHVKDLYRENLKGFMQYNFLKEVNGQMCYLLSDMCYRNNITYKELLGYSYLPANMLDEVDTVDEIIHWFHDCFERLIQIKIENNKYSRHIQDAMRYVIDNYDQPISLNEISEALNIHKVYLSRIFKEETGITISAYILNHKIMQAKRLIEATNMKIYEIAETTGFRNAQHFVVAFKKNTGITPKEFRDKRKK